MSVTTLRRLIAGALMTIVAIAATVWWSSSREPTTTYHALFADASELVPRHDVRINDVVVGAVDEVALDGLAARVTFHVDAGIDLPAASHATIRQASLLGDRFVELVPEGEGQLQAGTTIPLERTRRASDLETIVSSGSVFASSLGTDTLNRMLHAADEAFGSDPDALGRLIDRGGEAARAYLEVGADLDATIDRLADLAVAYAPRTQRLADAVDRAVGGLDTLASHGDDLARFTTELSAMTSAVSEVLEHNEAALLTFGTQLRQVLGEAVETLPEIARGTQALYDFNASWACIVDGHYLNQAFVLIPEAASIDYGPGHCDPEEGSTGRDMGGQWAVPFDDPPRPLHSPSPGPPTESPSPGGRP
ncbi:MAG: MCE family protein [Actinobacteria bacterium]|nr:MCE family protein [Actinomycetota bacterium]